VDVHFPNSVGTAIGSKDLAGSLSRFKTAFQIDKERIANSTAFRRLEYKTQVFVSHEGDHYRTRLTHTIEVNQAARFLALALRLNEDLVEAIALGHDLGHTPFGHSGEATLDLLFSLTATEAKERLSGVEEYFGPAFYHNVQSVRVVDSLEKGYEWDFRPLSEKHDLHNPISARGRGLDLTWAVREGILKHSSRGLRAGQIRMLGSKYLMDELRSFEAATLEGQVVEFADEVASLTHDLEDGLRSRLFRLNDLREVLMNQVNSYNLADLLGLTDRFGHDDNPSKRPRVQKYISLLKCIQEREDYTVGSILALIRSLFVSNITEATYWRLRRAMSGPMRLTPPRSVQIAPANELIWVHFNIPGAPSPTSDSYCPQAWESKDPGTREAIVHLYKRSKGAIECIFISELDQVGVWWAIKGTEPRESQFVIIKRGGKSMAYPLRNVCLTFGGAHIVGYHENLQPFCRDLRDSFIPKYLHCSPTVLRMNAKGRRFMRKLFELYRDNPSLMHHTALKRYNMWDLAVQNPEELKNRASFILRIVEHLQGMTDRYLNEEYLKLFLPGGNVQERDEMSIVDRED
jgi:predicted deoxyguanosinetriphosphate triphosphohydrolase